MVDFTPPFAQDGERRLPNLTEQQLGLSCDPVQLRELFNGLFWLLQGQVKNIADEAGVAPSQDGDITLLKRAVLALISASSGGGTADEYILMAQGRSRLPIFPDMQHNDGHLAVLSPSTGVVRVPAGRDFLHRGIYKVTTAETDFNTDPSKIYHLRWNPADGFVMRDLASGTYNPTALSEVNPVFDTTFDDMLVARIITNSSNVATVTNLQNRTRLTARAERASSLGDAGATGVVTNFTHNFARTPLAMLESTSPPGGDRDSDLWLEVSDLTRYGMNVRSWNWTAGVTASAHNSPGYKYNVVAS